MGEPGLLGGRGGEHSTDFVSPEGDIERPPSSFVRLTGGGAGRERWK